jgi:hypothetical protein
MITTIAIVLFFCLATMISNTPVLSTVDNDITQNNNDVNKTNFYHNKKLVR